MTEKTNIPKKYDELTGQKATEKRMPGSEDRMNHTMNKGINKSKVKAMTAVMLLIGVISEFGTCNYVKADVISYDEQEILSGTEDEEAAAKTEQLRNVDDLLYEMIVFGRVITIKDSQDLADKKNLDSYAIDGAMDVVNNRIFTFNDKYADDLMGTYNYTLEDIKNIVEENDGIPRSAKAYVCNYARKMIEYYEGIDTRIFATNLKTLRFEFKDAEQIREEIPGSNAYYDAKENRIVLKDDIVFSDKIDKLQLEHELGHAFSSINMSRGKYTFTSYFNYLYHGRAAKEALNVVFTTAPSRDNYDFEQLHNMGYRSISNIIWVLTDIMDYDLSKLAFNNVYDFEKKANKYFDGKYDINKFIDNLDEMVYEFEDVRFDENTEINKYMYEEISSMYIYDMEKKGASADEIYSSKEELKNRLLCGTQYTKTVSKIVDDYFNNYFGSTQEDMN